MQIHLCQIAKQQRHFSRLIVKRYLIWLALLSQDKAIRHFVNLSFRHSNQTCLPSEKGDKQSKGWRVA